MSHIFGPVPSRRLGRSLGVDLVPLKTCSYDCIYCQLGRTTRRTVERRQWVSPAEVLAELAGRLDSRPDHITLSGSGEPTLYTPLDELIAGIKRLTDVPVAVLTNGSLLWRPEVRAELLAADVVIPSLDAGDEAVFQAVNRPAAGVSFEKMLGGLIDFRREFSGRYWLEVFILAGRTDSEAEAARLAACAARIRPDRVQLNTVTRPPAEDFAVGVSPERLAELAGLFDPPAEVIADFRGAGPPPAGGAAGEAEILDMLRRRPCSAGDVAAGLAMDIRVADKLLARLAAAGLVTTAVVGGTVFYKPVRTRKDSQ